MVEEKYGIEYEEFINLWYAVIFSFIFFFFGSLLFMFLIIIFLSEYCIFVIVFIVGVVFFFIGYISVRFGKVLIKIVMIWNFVIGFLIMGVIFLFG